MLVTELESAGSVQPQQGQVEPQTATEHIVYHCPASPQELCRLLQKYVYELVASTGGGSGRSDGYVIQTPTASPERIPPPYNVTITGPRSLKVRNSKVGLRTAIVRAGQSQSYQEGGALSLQTDREVDVTSQNTSALLSGRIMFLYDPREVFNTNLPLEYNVLLNAGSEQALIRAAGRDQFLLLEGLEPFTPYQIRIQACQQGGCGVGASVYTQTSEAPPELLDPPTVTAAGPAVIDVSWRPPRKPNGLITAYLIHRRPVGTQEEQLAFVWSQGPLEFTDASEALQPFSEYEYYVQARNSRGSAHSPWASTLTMESEPEGMALPATTPTSAYSVLLNWTQPDLPNGIISQYRVVYQRHQSDPTLNASIVTALTVPTPQSGV
ncbi:hypothetical protein JZ751_002625 [Albula glossodonta]|uniref:Fibronectin type-III domain-containing protein n=1 Tax=Albula glossodonta TaxID=121402 RepID=A0A8T2NF18_9TELE|nr:hypothetical protein JZ751_002625 [Albula glossodonta]